MSSMHAFRLWPLIVVMLLIGLGTGTLATDHGQHGIRSQAPPWPNWDTFLDDVLQHGLWPVASATDAWFPYHNPWHLPQLRHNRYCQRCNNVATNQQHSICNSKTYDTEDRPQIETNTSDDEDVSIGNTHENNAEIEHLHRLYQHNLQKTKLIKKRIENIQTNMRTLRNGRINQKMSVTNNDVERPVESYSEKSGDRNIVDSEESHGLVDEDHDSRWSEKQPKFEVNSYEKKDEESEEVTGHEQRRPQHSSRTDHRRNRPTVNRARTQKIDNDDRNSRNNLLGDKQKTTDKQFLIIPLNGFLPNELKISYHGNNKIRVYGSRTCRLEEGCVAKEMDTSYHLPSRFNKDTFRARIHGDNIVFTENSRNTRTDSDENIQSIHNNNNNLHDTMADDDDNDVWEKDEQLRNNNINKRAEKLINNDRVEEIQNNNFLNRDESSDSWVEGVSIETED